MRTPAALLLAGLMALSGCTSFAGSGDQPSSAPSPDAERAATRAPQAGTTLVADADPVAAAVSASRALFDAAPVVVLARDGDLAGELAGASAAVGLGVPLLLQPAQGDASAAAGEVGRLGADAVLAIGSADAAGLGGVDVVPAAATPDAVAAATGLDLAGADPVAADGAAAAVAGLDPDAPAGLRAADAPAPSSSAVSSSPARDGARLPGVAHGDPRSSTLVLATGEASALAGLATARAAGARVQLTGGSADPRASADVVTALSQERPESVVALGADLAGNRDLDWELQTAATGTQLPAGGQLLFPQHFMVALYGSPGTPSLGVLGEQDLDATLERARQTADPYRSLVPDATVVPALEIIATVASSAAGPDGNYSTELPVDTLRPWVEAAGQAGMYVVLDLQSGRTDFRTQAEQYRSLLELPNVGLALDPEWRLGPGETHLTQIGSVGIDEVNGVVGWLADLTREKRLPQKLLVLHQFQLRMIPGRDRLDTSRPELALMVHADGQGSQGDKQATWQALHQDAPSPLAWGWKNFYDEDHPMLTPDQTIAQVSPRPQLISYQ